MRILVACEFSGVVRRAFRDRGHDAWSCDILEAEDGDPHHIQKDVQLVLEDGWDMMIAHPPCTYLCTMGIWWNSKRPERWEETSRAALFFKTLWNAPILRIAIENPVGWMNSNFRPPDQVIEPWMFGHEASKRTCLWLKNLPALEPTEVVGRGEFYVKANGWRLSKWNHKETGARGDGKKRASVAARTFEGIAQAMAEQWGDHPIPIQDELFRLTTIP